MDDLLEFNEHKHYKKLFLEEFGTARSFLLSIIFLFVWRREFGGSDIMHQFWSQIREQYP